MKTTPEAIDSPAEPMVCTMLFSRIVLLPSLLEDGDREHGDRDRRRDGEARLQGEVDGGRAEDDAEDGAEERSPSA